MNWVRKPPIAGPETAPKIYALWRLEHLLDGDAHHLSSGYAQRVLAITLKKPAWLDHEPEVTECKVVKDGLWPPVDVVERAADHAGVGIRTPLGPLRTSRGPRR